MLPVRGLKPTWFPLPAAKPRCKKNLMTPALCSPVEAGLQHVQTEMKYSAAVALFDLSHFLGIEFYLNFNLSPSVSWLSAQ